MKLWNPDVEEDEHERELTLSLFNKGQQGKDAIHESVARIMRKWGLVNTDDGAVYNCSGTTLQYKGKALSLDTLCELAVQHFFVTFKAHDAQSFKTAVFTQLSKAC
eukprot:10639964-Karenia_brevis.AAC.1